jgi:hypothetical protein
MSSYWLRRPDGVGARRTRGEDLPDLLVSDVGAIGVRKRQPCIANPLLEMLAVHRAILA